jgi:hypothetical protein
VYQANRRGRKKKEEGHLAPVWNAPPVAPILNTPPVAPILNIPPVVPIPVVAHVDAAATNFADNHSIRLTWYEFITQLFFKATDNLLL